MDLFTILPRICSSLFEARLFQSAFVWTFFGALRIGELVAPNRSSVASLRLSDVFLSDVCLKLFIQRSKTDQLGKGVWISLFPVSSPLCPLKVVRDYLAVRPSCLGSFLLHLDGSVLMRFQFSAILKKSLVALNLGHLKITSHSFRIGAATEAAKFGLHSDAIKRIGRWESDRFKIYVRP